MQETGFSILNLHPATNLHRGKGTISNTDMFVAGLCAHEVMRVVVAKPRW